VYWNDSTLLVVDNSSKAEVLELKKNIGDKGKERIRKAVYSEYVKQSK